MIFSTGVGTFFTTVLITCFSTCEKRTEMISAERGSGECEIELIAALSPRTVRASVSPRQQDKAAEPFARLDAG